MELVTARKVGEKIERTDLVSFVRWKWDSVGQQQNPHWGPSGQIAYNVGTQDVGAPQGHVPPEGSRPDVFRIRLIELRHGCPGWQPVLPVELNRFCAPLRLETVCSAADGRAAKIEGIDA